MNSRKSQGVKPLIVVLGLGEMGEVHARNLSSERRIRIGLASNRPEAASRLGNELCADKTYDSYEAVFDDGDAVGVVISTSPSTHPDMIRRCVESKKKYIFCEKPLGYESGAIRDVLDLIKESSDVHLMVGFMRRWDPGYWKAYNEDNKNGKVCLVKCTSGDAEYPEKYRRIEDNDDLNDVARHVLLKDLAVHDIDLARWYTKSEVRRVYASIDALTYPEIKKWGDGDMGVVIMHMESGAKVTMHLGRALRYGYNVSTEIVRVDGSSQVGGQLGSTDVREWTNDKGNALEIDADFRVRFERAFAREMKGFVDMVDVGTKGTDEEVNELIKKDRRYATGKDGLMATIVSEALVKSCESDMPVNVEYEDSKDN